METKKTSPKTLEKLIISSQKQTFLSYENFVSRWLVLQQLLIKNANEFFNENVNCKKTNGILHSLLFIVHIYRSFLFKDYITTETIT